MIPLPAEIERVEQDLIDRKITGREASEIVFRVRRKLGPPWHWKEWKIKVNRNTLRNLRGRIRSNSISSAHCEKPTFATIS